MLVVSFFGVCLSVKIKHRHMEKLTKEKAMERVEKIKSVAYDDETAHVEEDDLHSTFISCVAARMYGIDEAVEIADIVKSTSEISFSRWYA